jgi:hypothetical protein
VDRVAVAELIAEIGVDMTRFPSAAHLVSWAKFCPQIHQSAGSSRTKGRGKGNPWLAGTLGRIAFVDSGTDTLHGRDRQWCRAPRRINLSAAFLLPIDLLLRRQPRPVFGGVPTSADDAARKCNVSFDLRFESEDVYCSPGSSMRFRRPVLDEL